MTDQSIIALFFERQEDAEECENDTYLAAWDKIPPARPKFLSAFLAKITRNISLNKLREQNTQKRGGQTIVFPLSEPAKSIPDSTALTSLQPETLADSLNSFLKTLSPTERSVFLLHYWYCEPVDTIAQEYGFTKSKVKMMLKRTRDKLKNHLQKEGIL